MLKQQKLQEIAERLKVMYALRGHMRVVYVSTGLRDAIIEVGKRKFGITEKSDGIPIIAFGQPLWKVELNGPGRWKGTTLKGEALEADYSQKM